MQSYGATDPPLSMTSGSGATNWPAHAGAGSVETRTYNYSGFTSSIGSSYGPMVTSQYTTFSSTGATLNQTFGDAGKTAATSTYDKDGFITGYTLRARAQAPGSSTRAMRPTRRRSSRR